MPTKKSNYTNIPFDADGNLLRYFGGDTDSEAAKNKACRFGIRLLPNYLFSATLVFLGFQRGRSAAYALFKDYSNSKKYGMFLTDLESLLQNCNSNKGLIWGIWTFQKRGSNFGIRLVKIEEKKNDP
ncbi:MAG: hypothetical protein WC917_04600 [Bacilli bacterium]|jgi:hypothetical protein